MVSEKRKKVIIGCSGAAIASVFLCIILLNPQAEFLEVTLSQIGLYFAGAISATSAILWLLSDVFQRKILNQYDSYFLGSMTLVFDIGLYFGMRPF